MKKILIIEDDPIVSMGYANRLTYEGYSVETAIDGQEGIELIRRLQPEIVLLDLMIPKMSGIELLKIIRAEPEFKHLPIIVLSGAYNSAMVRQAWKAGATKCLSKVNFTPKQVLQVINSTLAARETAGGRARVKTQQPADAAPIPHVDQPLRAAAGGLQPLAAPLRSTGPAEAQYQVQVPPVGADLPTILAWLRAALPGLMKASTDAARQHQIRVLYRRIRGLVAQVGERGFILAAQLAGALESLLKALDEKPSCLTASTIRTIASAVDSLGLLLERVPTQGQQALSPAGILVVDDDAISRRAVTHALEKAGLRGVGLRDPVAACEMLTENHFDLIFLDIDMPGMNGLDLCRKIRRLPGYQKTPVVFVTGLADFENRVNSSKSGGTDFIAKPFLSAELAVKAIIHCLRSQTNPAKQRCL